MKMSLDSLRQIHITASGLTSAEVLQQRDRFGRNEIVELVTHPILRILSQTAKDPMIILLAFSGTLFLALKNYTEAITLYVSILPLMVMDMYLHQRTNASTRALRSKLTQECLVRRDNKDQLISTKDLVPGDLVVLHAGDFIPADGYLEECHSIQVDESFLTGESLGVDKAAREGELSLANQIYAGTHLLRGEGLLRVLLIGSKTEYGSILATLNQIPTMSTELQKNISVLVRRLTVSGLVLCVVLAAVRLYQGQGWIDALLSGAVLAVAAMPEEFPIVFSFFLGVGVYRLARVKALVKRAVTVENIGRVTRVCTDKTGTLTRGELALTSTYRPEFISEAELLKMAWIASNPGSPDPVDRAIQQKEDLIGGVTFRRVQTFPFTELRRKQITLAVENEGSWICAAKGAPETVLEMCAFSEDERKFWTDKVTDQAKQGKKILACARSSVDSALNVEPTSGFEFVGLLVFSDPIRPEVPAAVRYCRDQKIQILMLTGDHLSTATAIATEAGLGAGHPRVISAQDAPESFTQEKLKRETAFLNELDVIARCSPLQKLWIVQALKKDREVIVVTGDGVNDVPALQAADIGIAMGIRGVPSAREVASIVLADDNFATIVNAIKEGRQLFRNLHRSFEYLLVMQIPLVLGAAFVPLLGYSLLYLPIHLAWLELIIHPTALFAFQSPVAGVADSSDGAVNEQLFPRAKLISLVIESIFLLFAILAIYSTSVSGGRGEMAARSNVLALMCFISSGMVLRSTSLRGGAS